MRVLLWAYGGSGNQYWGPGKTAFRMYAKLRDPTIRVDLLHAAGERQITVDGTYTSILRLEKTLSNRTSQVQVALSASSVVRKIAGQYDVVHGLSAYAFALAPVLAAERVGLPSVVKVTGSSGEIGSGQTRGVAGLTRRAREVALRRVTAFIALSDEIRAGLLRLGVEESRIHMIPNGVDTDLFRPNVQDREDMRMVILFAGGLVPRKRVHLVVEALAEIRKELDATLRIAGPVGDPVYSKMVKELASELGVAKHVCFLGVVADMVALYQSADVVVLPSSSEGMANVLLEAMACEVPFVATPASGMNELVKGGGGMLVEPNATAIAHGVMEANSRKVELGRLGRNSVLANFSSTSVLQRHLDLFRSLV